MKPQRTLPNTTSCVSSFEGTGLIDVVKLIFSLEAWGLRQSQAKIRKWRGTDIEWSGLRRRMGGVSTVLSVVGHRYPRIFSCRKWL